MTEATKQNTYDEVPYSASVFAQSHPRRLATIAKIFGLESPPLETAAFLELGCADGTNILPMALEFPEAKFVGIDNSQRQIESGRQVVDSLGVKNLRLEQRNILEITPEFGKFDYIFAHGVYSWVPADVQDKILEICHRNLNPQGVAYISYNTYPGWRMRAMLRDMMLYHTAQFTDAKSKIQQARALIQFLGESVSSEKDPYGLLLQRELDGMSKWADAYIYHEFLEEVNEPVYFHEFCTRAAKHQLQYLGDAEFASMVTTNLGGKIAETLQRVGKNIVAAEQYMDFVRNRQFRQSLLCHANVPLKRNLTPEIIPGFCIAGRLTPNVEVKQLSNRDSVEFSVPSGAKINTTDPIVKAALMFLHESAPAAVKFQEIADAAKRKLRDEGTEPPANADAQLADVFLKLYVGNLIELARDPYRFTLTPGEKPIASPLCRLQAKRGRLVTNRRHEIVNLDVVAQQLVQHLDGEHDREALLDELVKQAHAGVLVLKTNDIPITEDSQIRQVMSQAMEKTLENCARSGLLVS